MVNDPAVRPHVGPGTDDLDLSSLIEAPLNLFPMGEYGGFALIWTAPATREVHTFVLPEGRGAWARDAALEMIGMAAAEGTRVLWTQIDAQSRHVRAYARAAGMRPTGEILRTFGRPHIVYSMGVSTCQ